METKHPRACFWSAPASHSVSPPSPHLVRAQQQQRGEEDADGAAPGEAVVPADV